MKSFSSALETVLEASTGGVVGVGPWAAVPGVVAWEAGALSPFGSAPGTGVEADMGGVVRVGVELPNAAPCGFPA